MRDYSNYHKVNAKEKLKRDGNLIFERALQNGYESYDVLIDGINQRVIIQSKFSDKDGDKRNILSKTNLINRGNQIVYENQDWLVISLPEDNGIYAKAVFQLCNTTLFIQPEPIIIDYDKFARPIYDKNVQPIEIPCIAETSIVSNDLDNPINLPENKIKATLPYREFTLGEEISLYDDTYTITGIDKTKSIHKRGLITLTGERKV